MPTIKNVARLTKRCVLANFLAKPGLAITPLIVGQHGIGKSQIVHEIANNINGYCFIIEGASIGEKEVSGLPFAAPTSNGSTEVRYVKHYVVNTIYNLEKFYYSKAVKEGFLNGFVKIEEKESGEVVLHEGEKTTTIMTAEGAVVAGEDNRYKFGEYLSPSTKFKLVESGEVKPVVLFIDELNRTEVMIQKELMNIILNKNVSGYNLPWFCNIVAAINPCSQNSSYATNEMDPAQLDRFLKIKADASVDEFVDYGLNNGMNSDILEAIAISEGIFIQRDSSLEDTSDLTPTPRSWEIVSHIYTTLDMVNNTRFFNQEEKALKDDDFRVLARGKVGDTAGRTLIENLKRKEFNIKPEEIITMKNLQIDPKVKEKFSNLKRLTQKIICDNVVNFILKQLEGITKLKTSSKQEDKTKYLNWKSQIKEFVLMLDSTTQYLFLTKIIDKGGMKGYTEVSSYFSREALAQVLQTKGAIKDLNNLE